MKTNKNSLTFPHSMLEFAICSVFPRGNHMIVEVFDFGSSEQLESMEIRYQTLEEADLLIPATAVGSYMPNVLRAAIAGDAEGVKVITRHIRDIPGEPITKLIVLLQRFGYQKIKTAPLMLPEKNDIIVYHGNYGHAIDTDRGWIGMITKVSVKHGQLKVCAIGAQRWNVQGSLEDEQYVSLITSYRLNLSKVSVYRGYSSR
jgi:hypothetical protein